jgi:hypothetical protein
MRLIPGVLALVLFSGATRLVLGRNIDITWTLGENYAPIDAAIGDTLVRFMIMGTAAYSSGFHWMTKYVSVERVSLRPCDASACTGLFM